MKNVYDRALLVTLRQRAWKGLVMDRDLAEQTEKANDAQMGTMRVIKELTPKEYVQPIYRAMQLGRQEHYAMTVPGLLKGQHLLATAMWERYCLVQHEIKHKFEQRTESFFEIYPEIVRDAPKRLMNAYKESDFPTVQQIRSYFEYEVKFAPIPEFKDWRLENLSETDTTALRNEIEDEVRSMYNNATQEVFNRARDVLEKVYSQANAFNAGTGGFREATIAHLKEMASVIVKMNVTDDPELGKLGSEMIEQFADCKIEALRNDAAVRNNIAAAAKRMLARIPKVET